MVTIDGTEAWKQIPPEEKVELMSRAHASGVFAALCFIGVGCTIALALHIPALVWMSLLFCPLIFQFAAGRAWRGLRPRVMLEYLAARSAVRRFAFSAGAKDLQLNLLFRGQLQRIVTAEQAEHSIEEAGLKVEEAAVWVALFRDTVVMISEMPGGAVLSFGHALDDRLKCESSDKGGYSANKELILSAVSRHSEMESRYRLRSKYPAALVVFEKRLAQFTSELKLARENTISSLAAGMGDEDSVDSQTSNSLFG